MINIYYAFKNHIKNLMFVWLMIPFMYDTDEFLHLFTYI